jgi:aryl-alcohol dehydrogenase-like predicted oxidoreductase
MMKQKRTLGSQGLEVSAQGLGCMGMSIGYGSADERESIATLHRALDLGVDFFDTAELYGPHTNEQLLGRALDGWRDEVKLATKFGVRHADPNDPGRPFPDGTPENVRRSIEGSLERLGTDHVDLYYQHRIDPDVPVEETVGAMAELVREGKVLHIGLSEASAETIRRAHAVHPLTAVQTEYSLFARDVEDEVLPTLRELGIGLVAYAPLGRGLLSGRFRSHDDLEADDFRRTVPRLSGENLERNLGLLDKVEELAEEKGCTTGQLAIAWVMAQGDDVVPIPGTKRRSYLEENVAAAAIELTDDDLARIDAEVPEAAGERYNESGMRAVNV